MQFNDKRHLAVILLKERNYSMQYHDLEVGEI